MNRKTKGRKVVLLTSLLACISCKSPATEPSQEHTRSSTEAACLFPLEARSADPIRITDVTAFLNDLFVSSSDAYVDRVGLDNLKTVVVAVPYECQSEQARKLPTSVNGLLSQHGLSFTLGKGSAKVSAPRPDMGGASTLPELLSAASRGQAQLKDCVFVFDLNRGVSATVEQEQDFRAKLENTQ